MPETPLQYLGRVPLYYHEMTLPCAWDDGIFRLITSLPRLPLKEHRSFVAGLDADTAGTLAVYAGRMAMLSVRKHDPALLAAGLAARGLALIPADLEGERMALCELTQLYHSARKLGLDPESMFHEAVSLAGTESAGILTFLEREPRNQTIECMGVFEREGPSGLIYWSGDCPIAEGLLYDRPTIPDELREFWAAHDISLFCRGLFETAKPILSCLSGDERSRVEKLHMDAFRAGSRDSRVILGLGWLRSLLAVPDVQALMLSSGQPDQVRADAAVALRTITADDRALETLLSILSTSSSSYTRQAVVTALREFPAKETEPVLKKALLDRDKPVRTEAVYSLLAQHGMTGDQLDWPRFMSDLMLGRPEAVAEIERQIAERVLPPR